MSPNPRSRIINWKMRHLKQARFDFYAALMPAGKLTVDNADGSGRYSDAYNIAPALGATLAVHF